MSASPPNVADRLTKTKQGLLDLTLRNRLLNTPRKAKGRNIEIVAERTEDLYRILVAEKKSLSFAARPGSDDSTPTKSRRGGKSFRDAPKVDFETADPAQPLTAAARDLESPSAAAPSTDDSEPWLPQPDEPAAEAEKRRTDDRLQTGLTSDTLQKRLLGLFYDARTYEEEQGVNILYLALGFLKWFEADKPDQARFAPLLLVPVELSRTSAGANFRLRWREEEAATNLSLQAKLFADFGLKFPDVVDSEEFTPTKYFDEVRAAIAGKSGWEVLPDDMVLWFFSFTKFLMYRDLDPTTWPEAAEIDRHPLIAGLLVSGFKPEPPFCSDADRLDAVLAPLDQTHVVDADSSQAVATEETRRGRNLVIQGPPGTGKSQTIANIIATAVRNGKKVLFVAEKMAALSVVKRRFDNIGLGDICLELHSAKANKKLVLQELERTLALGPPQQDNVEQQAAGLAKLRERLNQHVADLHMPLAPAGLTPFAILGDVCRLQAAGAPTLDLALVEPLKWTPEQVAEKVDALRAVAGQIAEIGVPDKHPWRGVRLDAWLPMNAPRLQQRLPAILDKLNALIRATDALAGELHLPIAARSLAESDGLVRMIDAVEKAPPMDRAAIGSAVWDANRAGIESLVEAGFTLGDTRARLEPLVRPEAWSRDVGEARDALLKYGRLWYRWFFGAHRAAIALLQSIMIGPVPKRFDDRIAILDAIARRQAAQKKLGGEQQAAELGRQAFGTMWNGEKSDWAALRAIEQWEDDCRTAGISTQLRAVMTTVQASPNARNAAAEVTAVGGRQLATDLQAIFQELQLDITGAFDKPKLDDIPLAELRDRIAAWPTEFESLTKWIAYRHARTALEKQGLGTLPTLLAAGTIAGPDAVDRFTMAYYESLLRAAFTSRPSLAQFDGKSYTQIREQFQEADRKRIDLTRLEVAAAHFRGIPTGTGDIGELGTVQHEIKKRKNHKPIRRLIKEAGRAIQAIKPVFMMSPMSVAQFLDPTSTSFDLLVFDEASQVRPEDALGAIARAKQVVVVGDDKQLPPTRFFDVLEGDSETEEGADDFNVGDLDSVLALCKSQQMTERMLRWHYRSRHQSLIAVSNHEFYDDKLFIFPSPLRESGQGLKFHLVKEGRFDRGASATNRVEARVVAEAVMHHARTQPHVSLGVGAFSVSQRDAILDELEILRRESKDTEEFFATGGPEPFFVKNLENIQGDERESIFISVGYARDKSGNLAMNFGPLSNKGGERRLNVLISRARSSCEVFSSITADDIDLGRATAVGAKAFKTFLHYAQTGSLDVGAAAAARFETEFERQVAAALRGAGFQVESQVGVAGFFVDLAVVDPEVPSGYVLGIECDGKQYEAARSSRDRDRLRQQVLEDRGWMIHRLWSVDWFHRPNEQLAKLTEAIKAAKAAALLAAQQRADAARAESARAEAARAAVAAPTPTSSASATTKPTDPPAAPTIARVERQEPDDLAAPYVEADFKISGKTPIPEMPLKTLMDYAVRVVVIEGPIHGDEVERRLVALVGAARTGARIEQAVADALGEAVKLRLLVAADGFYRPADQTAPPIRNREAVDSAGLKKPEMLPPSEIEAAIKALVAGHVGVTDDECITAVARTLGFKTTSPAIKEVIARCLEHLVAGGGIVRKNDVLQLHA